MSTPTHIGMASLANTPTSRAIDVRAPNDIEVQYPYPYGSQKFANQNDEQLNTLVRALEKFGPPKSSLGNPGPLGLAAFASTTFMLSTYNTGLIHGASTIVLPMALWFGGIAQVLAGMWEFSMNNTFGATAFTSYGFFWIAYATTVEFAVPELLAGGMNAFDLSQALGLFLLVWTIFTFYMMIASFRQSVVLAGVFVFLLPTFALLTAGEFAHGNCNNCTKAGGWFGLVTAAWAFYGSAAVVINASFGFQFAPIGVMKLSNKQAA